MIDNYYEQTYFQFSIFLFLILKFDYFLLQILDFVIYLWGKKTIFGLGLSSHILFSVTNVISLL